MELNAVKITGTLDKVREVAGAYIRLHPSFNYHSTSRKLILKKWRLMWLYEITLFEWPPTECKLCK